MTQIQQVLFKDANFTTCNIFDDFGLTKLEIIAQKSLNNGDKFNLVIQKILADDCLQQIQRQFGKRQAIALVLYLINRVLDKELDELFLCSYNQLE